MNLFRFQKLYNTPFMQQEIILERFSDKVQGLMSAFILLKF